MASAEQLRSSGELLIISDEGANTDWQDEVLRTGFSHNHNLAISGGNKTSSLMPVFLIWTAMVSSEELI